MTPERIAWHFVRGYITRKPEHIAAIKAEVAKLEEYIKNNPARVRAKKGKGLDNAAQ